MANPTDSDVINDFTLGNKPNVVQREFQLTPNGWYDLKVDWQPDPRLSTDRCLPLDTPSVLARPKFASNYYQRNQVRCVEAGLQGMQTQNPAQFLEMLREATTNPEYIGQQVRVFAEDVHSTSHA